MSREEIQDQKKYYYVIDGTFRQKVEQDHPQAKRRDWKTSDGKTGTKFERHVPALYGYIKNVQFYDGDYGRQIQITLDETEDGSIPTISLSASGREGNDFMRKLPNINLEKEVKFAPYSFESEGDERRGLTLYQENEAHSFVQKTKDFFRDTEKKENKNGMPNPPKPHDEMTKNAWKAYFLNVDDFLVDYTIKNIQPKFTGYVSEQIQKEKKLKAPSYEDVMPSAAEKSEMTDDLGIPF